MVLFYRNNTLLTPRYQRTLLVRTFKGCVYDTFTRLYFCQHSSEKEAEKRCLPRETNFTTGRHDNGRKHEATYYCRGCFNYARCIANSWNRMACIVKTSYCYRLLNLALRAWLALGILRTAWKRENKMFSTGLSTIKEITRRYLLSI